MHRCVATIAHAKVMEVRKLVPGQNEEGAHATGEKNKEFDEKSLEEIINPALSELSSQSNETSRYLASLARNGFLEQHQTRGNITEIAEELLRKLREGNDDENQST